MLRTGKSSCLARTPSSHPKIRDMVSPRQHGPSPAEGASSVAYRLVAILGIASPLITYLIATSPFSYTAKIGGVIAVSVCSAALSILYVSKQNKARVPENADMRQWPVSATSFDIDRPALSKSLTDPITGLPNERALEIVLENQLTESRRHPEERPLGLVSLEIRDLAAIGDDHGPETVDRMIAFFAENLLFVVRTLDFVVRVGDEFYVVLPSAGEAALVEATGRIAKQFDDLFLEADASRSIPVRPYFGWAVYPQDGETADKLVRAAMLQKEQTKAEALLYEGELDLEYVH